MNSFQFILFVWNETLWAKLTFDETQFLILEPKGPLIDIMFSVSRKSASTPKNQNFIKPA